MYLAIYGQLLCMAKSPTASGSSSWETALLGCKQICHKFRHVEASVQGFPQSTETGYGEGTDQVDFIQRNS